MVIPSENEIIGIIRRHAYTDIAYFGYHGEDIVEAAKDIISHTKEAQPTVDPNLVKIAELEAKIKVYETVIEGAGLKLAMPKNKAK